MGSFFGGAQKTTKPESVIPPDVTGARGQFGDVLTRSPTEILGEFGMDPNTANPDYLGFIRKLLLSPSAGGGLPRASTGVAPLDPNIQGFLDQLRGAQSQAGAPGAITSARSTLEELIRTGLPTATGGLEDALLQKKNLLDESRRANITEEFGSRGSRYGSPLTIGLGRAQELSDADYLNTIANLRTSSAESASGRRLAGTMGAPGFEQGDIARLLSTIIPGLNMSPLLQARAQLGPQLNREEDIRSQEGILRYILPYLTGGVGQGTPQTTTGASPFASIFGPLASIGGSYAGSASGGAAITSLLTSLFGCWVAEALYGSQTREHLLARYWIGTAWKGPVASIVRWLYQRFGQRIAALVTTSPWLARLLRPLFDVAVRNGALALQREGLSYG